MPLTVPIDLDELAETRFAISPLSETVAALQQLSGRCQREANRPWLRWARDDLAARPLELPRSWPLLVTERDIFPQFFTPAPTGPSSTIDDDLATLGRTPARQVRASLRRIFGADPPDAAAELARHPAAGLRAIGAELRTAYERLVEPHWPRIRPVLEADVAYRARRLAAGGAKGLFADLHPDLRWGDGRLTVDQRPDRVIAPAPGGLVLMPVALGTAFVSVKGHTTTRTTIRYPARGVGTLWIAGTRPPRDGVVRLLGRPRARLLSALRSPATTTDLAGALGVTPSAVAQHLAVLRECGLVAGERVGRSVLYLTTERGDALLD